MANCFTPEEIEKYNLKGLTPDQQIKQINAVMDRTKNSLRQNKLQAIVVNKSLQQVLSHPKGARYGLKSFLYTDRHELSGTSGLEAKMNAVNGEAHNKIYEIMEEFMPRKWGLSTNKKGQLDFVRALFGQQVENAEYSKFATAWRELSEGLRKRYNNAGGDIKKLDDWNLPQRHDPFILKERGFESWFKDIRDWIDLEGMELTEAEAFVKLREVYDNIVSGGMEQFEPGKSFGRSKLANRHQEARFIKFKDAESWINYHEKYTDTSPYAMMMDHVTMVSNEIALMENLGPNADQGFRTLAEHVIQKEKNPNAADFAEKAYANLAGKTAPHNRKFADRMQSLRNLVTGLKLPGAALSALPDIMFNTFTAKYNGLPAMKVATRFIKTLSTQSKEDRQLAAKLWMPLNQAIDEAHAAMRFADVAGQTGTSRFASFIMRGSGLNAWTVAGKMAFHTEFMSALAEADLHPNMLRTFKRYGINESDIKSIKKSKKLVKNGVKYLNPELLPKETASKIVSMVISETKYAVPEGDAMVRAVLNQGTRKGEVAGELLRSAGMFKTFMATIITNHWARALRGFEGNKGSRLGYATSMVIGTWALGTIVVQLKEIAAGREPIDWDNKELWDKGALQGGIFSIIGDIYSSDARSYGQSAQEFLLGPMASDVNKILWKGILGDFDTMRDADKELDGHPSLLKIAPDFIPGQFWYTKAIMERTFIDSLRKLSDPNWETKQLTKESKRIEKFGNERWW